MVACSRNNERHFHDTLYTHRSGSYNVCRKEPTFLGKVKFGEMICDLIFKIYLIAPYGWIMFVVNAKGVQHEW